jgi:hypothetical protein
MAGNARVAREANAHAGRNRETHAQYTHTGVVGGLLLMIRFCSPFGVIALLLGGDFAPRLLLLLS